MKKKYYKVLASYDGVYYKLGYTDDPKQNLIAQIDNGHSKENIKYIPQS